MNVNNIKNKDDFMYANQFHWFMGVIEDVMDPEERGRYRVRCWGYHTERKDYIPTTALPWSHVMLPVTSASQSGVGQSPTGLLRGTWVVGFFRDGQTAQDPIIMGSLPSITPTVDYGFGFCDPVEEYPYDDKIGDPDMPEEALEKAATNFKLSYSYLKKDEYRAKLDPVPIAMNGIWELPPLVDIIDVKYPKNHVRAYERKLDPVQVPGAPGPTTGILEPTPVVFEGMIGVGKPKTMHVEEFDVTPDFERVSTMHKSGTYKEWTQVGDETVVIVGKEFRIVCKDQHIDVKGKCTLTYEGDVHVLIEGNQYIHVRGDRIEWIEGEFKQRVDGPVTRYFGATYDLDVAGMHKSIIGGARDESVLGQKLTKVAGIYSMNSNGNMNLRAPRIDLNDAGPTGPDALRDLALPDSPIPVPPVDLVERE